MKTLIKLLALSLAAMSLPAQQNAPKIADFDASFLNLNYQMNLGEVLGVAVNSKGTIVVLNHPGSATTGPIYGSAATQLSSLPLKAISHVSWPMAFTAWATRTRCGSIAMTICAVADGLENFAIARAIEGTPSRESFVSHHPQGKLVGKRRRRLQVQLLRRLVVDRSLHRGSIGCRREARDTKVNNLYRVAVQDENVTRLDIAVDSA